MIGLTAFGAEIGFLIHDLDFKWEKDSQVKIVAHGVPIID
jgi:hypothetical protein